ncbi:LacI family DNA-binding transcriptional regulator [Bradyrhizobium cenepequi]
MATHRRVKLQDVARHAGVSAATVSRAIAQPELVSAETLARVRSSAAQLGYVPDGAARALASGKSMTIGAVVPTLDSAIFSRALQSMQVTLSRRGYQLLIASHDYSSATEAEAVRTLLTRGVDGLMLVGAQRPDPTWDLLQTSGVPVVLTWCSNKRFHSVVVDNEKAGRMAAQHLIDLGHKRIGAVIGACQFNDRQMSRLVGMRAALRNAGLDLPDWRVTEQPLTLAGGRTGCALMLALDDPPTAVIGGIDILAIGCIEEAHSRGLSVPETLSIVGIDDIEMSGHIFPPLTSVHLPVSQIGESAANSLLEQIEGKSKQGAIDLPIELVSRKSTSKVRSR